MTVYYRGASLLGIYPGNSARIDKEIPDGTAVKISGRYMPDKNDYIWQSGKAVRVKER